MSDFLPPALTGTAAPLTSDELTAAVDRGYPTDLITLYRHTDGLLTDSGIAIYALADIEERNQTYEIAEYAPGYLLIGDDSGGRGFLMRRGIEERAVVSSGLGDLEPTGFVPVADDIEGWLEVLSHPAVDDGGPPPPPRTHR